MGARRTRGTHARAARGRLRHFRRASIIAVAFTGLLLMLASPAETTTSQAADTAGAPVADLIPDTVAIIREVPVEALQPAADTGATDTASVLESAAEATRTLQQLGVELVEFLPKLGIALLILLVAWGVSRLARPFLRRISRSWTRANGFAALFSVVVWLLAAGIAFTVLTGDVVALVGSVGLVGLALSWALQTPIESFTGWLVNSFKGYYRVGDRIAVADVYGDVYRIDALTTTVWEYGGIGRPDVHVQGEQPTGRLITFPNNLVLTGTITNYTRDFAFVWDELSLEFATSTDTPYLIELLRRAAREEIGDAMREPAMIYGEILRREGLEATIVEEPAVFVTISEGGWLEGTIRYLAPARELRVWKSRLVARVLADLATPESKERVQGANPKRLLQLLDAAGHPVTPGAEPV